MPTDVQPDEQTKTKINKPSPTNDDIIKRIDELEVSLFKKVLDYLDTMKQDILAAVDAKLDIFENNMREFKDYINKRVEYQDKIIDTISTDVDLVKTNEKKGNMNNMIYSMAGLLVIDTLLLIYLAIRVLTG